MGGAELMGEQLVFYALGFLLVTSSLLAATVRNIFHAAIYLIVALFSVAGFFILLQAEFLAAVQVLIYVGAVAVLMIFAVMLTSRITDARVQAQNSQVGVGAVVALVLFMVISFCVWSTNWEVSPLPMEVDNTRALGRMIMTKFVLPFEIVSVLLLAAMVGAIVIASKEKPKAGEEASGA
jgi:NADH-quinone oxidoreductase subunit J